MRRITDRALEQYVAMLRERTWNGHPVKASTINNRVRALRAFFRWANENGYTRTQLMKKIKPPRIPFELIVPLTDQEIIRIFKAVQTPRDKAVIAVLVDSGLRASELTGLSVDDVNLEMGVHKVTGKGSKERYVPFGDATTRRIEAYLDVRPRDVLTDRMFLTTRRAPMERRNLQGLMRILKGRTGITRLHAHLFRHTYATRFLLSGGSMLLLKACLGHTSMEMVDRYVHLASQQAIDLGRVHSPLDALEQGGSAPPAHRGYVDPRAELFG